MRRILPPLTILLAVLLQAGTAAGVPVRVTVAIPPLAWFVAQIAGEAATVDILLEPGDSPATFEPTPRQMTTLQQADLFLAAGVPFEQGLRPRIEALAGGPLCRGPRATGGHRHDHDGLDPHSWLSPAGARAMADTVAAALTELAPDQARVFAEGRAAVEARITAVAAEAAARLAAKRGAVFVVFHPSFGHLAAAYGLRQVAIERDGHEPGARHLATVTDLARDQGVGAVIVQPQFSRRAAAAVAAAIGIPLIELDPLAADWDTNFLHIAEVLGTVAGDESEHP